MKHVFLWAVLCTASTTCFAMDQLPYDQYPPSPGKIISEEDIKVLLEETNPAIAHEEPRSTSSSPIPEDPSQEQINDPTIPHESVAEAVKKIQNFQTQFKQWINSEDIQAFRSFLFSNIEKHISDEIIEFARQKKESTRSDAAYEIYNLLSHLKFGKDNHFGDMEKLWHHTFDDEIKEKRHTTSDICETSVVAIDHEDGSHLRPDHYELISVPQVNFFQQKSIFNIALRDLIEQQKLKDIVDLFYELTKNNNCDITQIISHKTVKIAYQKMLSDQTETSKTIYGIISGQAKNIIFTETDTTAEALERVLCDEINYDVLSSATQKRMMQYMLLSYIENSDFGGICRFRNAYNSDTEAAELITPDLLETAKIIRDRVSALHEFLDYRRINEAHKVWEKLDQIFNNPSSVVLSTSGSNSNYSEDESDTQIVIDRIKNAFTQPVLKSIVGAQKEEKILLLLADEKRKQKHEELDWESP